MKQGSHQSAVAFVAFLVVLSAGARLLRPDGEPVVPADAAGLDLAAYRAKAQHALDEEKERQRPLAAGERIAVNRADIDQLARLPGVGVSLARRIVTERQQGGGFRTTTDLTRVPGIGERTAGNLAEHIDFSGAGPPTRSARGTDGSAASPPPPASRYDASTGRRVHDGSGREERGPDVSVTSRAAGGGATVVVDVNRASAGELQRLRGIGPALARRIVAYRDSAGPFRTVDQLTEVRGIGPATLKRIRANVRVR
ncbi:MAG: helix-hairpin-helix domain-containing protein [Gemmatimonadota bacterium]